MDFEKLEQIADLISRFGTKKLEEYKSKRNFQKLFKSTGEFLIDKLDDPDQLLADIEVLLSHDNMKNMADMMKNTNGFELKDALTREIDALMNEYEIPHDNAIYFENHFFEMVISDIKENEPEKYREYHFESKMDSLKNELQNTNSRINGLSEAFASLQPNSMIYSMDKMELILRHQTTNPSLGLGFFKVDDEEFQEKFEDMLGEECIYVKGQCREETIYCILNELRRLDIPKTVLVVKSMKDWENLQRMSEGTQELQGLILIPWFNSYEITAIQNNTNIFVFGREDYCPGKSQIELKKRLRKTVLDGLISCGADEERAYHLIEDTHGLHPLLKKKLFHGVSNEPPSWLSEEKRLILPMALCGKWQDEDEDYNIISKLSGLSKDQIDEMLQQLCKGEEPFLVRYEIHRRKIYQIASLENTWKYLQEDFRDNKNLWKKFARTLIDIAINKNASAELFGGMLNSVAIVASNTEEIKGQGYSNCIANQLLENVHDIEDWKYIAQQFPILCDAAPRVAYNRINQELDNPTGFVELLKFKSDWTLTTNDCRYILNGIEGFLVQKEYASGAARFLMKLFNMNIGDPLHYGPKDILEKVFCAWLNLTALSIEERVEFAVNLVEECGGGWDLLYNELPGKMNTIVGSIHHPIYREVDEIPELGEQDIQYLFRSFAMICIENMDMVNERYIKMIREAGELDNDTEEQLFAQIEKDLPGMDDLSRISIKEELRREIYRYRYFKNAPLAIDEARIQSYENLHSRIKTRLPEYEYRYLFANEYGFPLLNPDPYEEGNSSKSDISNKKAAENEIQTRLDEFCNNGLDLVTLIKACDGAETQNLAKYLFKYYSRGEFQIEVFELLMDNSNDSSRCTNYLKCAYDYGNNCILEAVKLSKSKNKDNKFLASLYSLEKIDAEIEPLIANESDEIKHYYWSKFLHCHKDDDATICYMLEECSRYGTFESFLDILSDAVSVINIDELIKYFPQLKKLHGDYEEQRELSRIKIGYVLGTLQDAVIDNSEFCEMIAQEEKHYYYHRFLEWDNMKCLKRTLETSPKLYAEMVSHVFLRDDEESEDRDSIANTTIKQGTMRNVSSLYFDAEFCPAERKGIILEDDLTAWIDTFSDLLRQQGQGKLFGMLLGRLLALAPKDIDGTPASEAICKAIEKYGDESLMRSYRICILNQRGAYIFTAGREERQIAKRYKKISETLAEKGYSKCSSIYGSLYYQYEYEARSDRELEENEWR